MVNSSRIILFLLVSIAAGLGGPVAAQTPLPAPLDSAGHPFLIPGIEVEVTRSHRDVTRVPQAVSVVGEARIQVAQRQVTIDEALRGIPGVYAANRNNYTVGEGIRLNIRAPMARLGTRGIQLLQDGIPLTMADGTTLPNNLDLGSAGRIEVIRGPSSVLYGNSAGGVVSVETALPSAGPLTVRPEVQFGADGYDRQQVKVGGTAGALGYLVNLNRMQTDNFRRYGAAEIRRANVVARARLSEHTRLRGIFNLYDMPFAENPSTLNRADALNNPSTVRQQAFDQGWGKSVTQGQGGVHLEHDLGAGQVLRVLGWGVWRDNWNPIPSQIIDLQRTAQGVRSEYSGEARPGGIPLEWTTGFDLSYQRDDRHEFANRGVLTPGGRAQEGALQVDQLEEVLSMGPFLQATARPGAGLGLTAGVRYDHYAFDATDRRLSDGDQTGARTLSAASPMVGVTFTPRPGLNLFANYSTAYQTPTTVELSNRPDGAGGFNQELEPEYLHSLEGGVRGAHFGWRVGYEVTGYLSTIDNALVGYQGANEQTYFRNAGKTSRNGVEAALTWLPVRTLEARLAYVYQDFEFLRFQSGANDFSGNREPGAPPQSVFAGLTHTAPWGLTSAVDLRWMDRYSVNDANTASNWAYTVVDARAGLDLKRGRASLRPFIGVDNLFDERYNASATINAVAARFYEPSPGRSLYVGLQMGGGL